jgi:plastocyanin
MRSVGVPYGPLVLLGSLLVASCGGASPSAPSSPSSGGTDAATTFTISSSGVSPKELTVSPGTRVTFINNDSRSHNMSSDPHPDHTDCPEINQVGLLQPAQSRQTGNLVIVRTCGFHDHDNAQNAALQGRIVIR